MLLPYQCPHCNSLGFINRELIGKVVKCLECGKIMILKSDEETSTKVPKTLHATVSTRLNINDIKKMSAKTLINAEFVDADDLAVNSSDSNSDNHLKSQEIDADDLAVD
ncbi:MAG: hypothetical protein K8S87_09840 [Planctomycetes bacterium]|nr:hypothetical protein [Planctomycetota bacterium]